MFFRKIKYAILSLIAFVVIGVGAGVSYWVYAQEGFNKEINSDSNIDNIYENYTFGKESITDKYDIYFFPSTYYLYRYANQEAERIDKEKTGNASVTNPEDIYGYLEYNNDDKILTYDNVNKDTNSAISDEYGSNKYHIDINGLNGCFSDLDSYVEYEGHWGFFEWVTDVEYSENLGTYLSIDYDGNSVSYYGYNATKSVKIGHDWVYQYKDVIDVNLSNIDENQVCFGSVSEDKTDSNGNNTTIDDIDKNSNIYKKYFDLEKADPFYQRLEIDDRLGYWPNLDVNNGRYLPIKLSFDSYIDYKQITEVISDPKTDMGDANKWFTSKFSGWISVKSNDRNSYSNFLPVDGFKYKDQNYLFDFMSNLKKYAEFDNKTGRYVIRLFPTFSNGKNYEEVKKQGNHIAANGYRDGIRLDCFNINDVDQHLSMDTRFFSFKGYSEEETPDTYENLYLSYAFINNFSFDESTKAIELRGTKIRDSSWIQVDEYNGGVLNNSKDWLDFRNGDIVLGEDIKIINSLSADKLYNIYAITGLPDGQHYYNSVDTAISTLKSALYTTKDGKEVLKTGNDFPINDLKGKQLYDFGTYVIGGNTSDGDTYGVYTILYEEVADLRLIQNVDIIKTSEGNYTEDPNNPLYEYVTNESSNSRGLAMNTDNLYTGTISINSSNQNIINDVTPISTNNPYIYRIDGVDFRFSDTLSFTIAINGKINNLMNFNLEPLDKTSNKKLISSSNQIDNGYILPEGEKIFTNASDFVELCKTTAKDTNGDTVTYNVLKLKPLNDNDNAKGYYTFIFEFESSTKMFNVYCYRFKNIFVKVFDQKPDTYNDENEDYYDFLNHNSGEYFTCEYYAGNSINPLDDLYVPANSSNVTSPENLEYIFKYFVNRRLESNLSTDDYKDTSDADNKSAYYLIDSVSERVLGVANCENKTINNVTFAKDLSLSKNYVFYVVSKTYYEKNMLK